MEAGWCSAQGCATNCYYERIHKYRLTSRHCESTHGACPCPRTRYRSFGTQHFPRCGHKVSALAPYGETSRYLLVSYFCITTNYGLSSRYPCDRAQIRRLGPLSHRAIILIPMRPSTFSRSYYLDRAVVCVGPPNSSIYSACKACALKLVKLVSGQICREAKKVSL